jgi:hypothetical protein
VGALVGLVALHPADLGRRIAPLLAPGAPAFVRVAAKKALAESGRCGVMSKPSR